MNARRVHIPLTLRDKRTIDPLVPTTRLKPQFDVFGDPKAISLHGNQTPLAQEGVGFGQRRLV
jgi:hypothetical protein